MKGKLLPCLALQPWTEYLEQMVHMWIKCSLCVWLGDIFENLGVWTSRHRTFPYSMLHFTDRNPRDQTLLCSWRGGSSLGPGLHSV